MESKEGFLREKFTGYGSAPEEGAWSSIVLALDKADNKKRGVIWWFSGAALVVILLGVSSLWNARMSPASSATVQSLNICNSSRILCGTGSNNKNLQKSPESLGGILKNKNYQASKSLSGKVIYKKNQKGRGPIDSAANNAKVNTTLIAQTDFGVGKYEALLNLPRIQEGRLKINKDKINPNTTIEKRNTKRVWHHEIGIAFGRGRIIGYQQPSSNIYDSSFGLENALIGASSLSLESSRSLSLSYVSGLSFGRRWEFRTGIELGFYTRKIADSEGSFNRARQMNAGVLIAIRSNFSLKKRIQFFTEAAGLLEFPLFRTDFSEVGIEVSDKISFNNGITPGIAFKGGVKFILNDNRSLNLGPEVRYYFRTPLTSAFRIHSPFWFGIGLAYQF